jgi:hypothetical protein
VLNEFTWELIRISEDVGSEEFKKPRGAAKALQGGIDEASVAKIAKACGSASQSLNDFGE